MPVWLEVVPAGQSLKKLTANKNMQYALLLIKTNLRTQGKFLRKKKF